MLKPTQHITAIFCNRRSSMVASVYIVICYILKYDDERIADQRLFVTFIVPYPCKRGVIQVHTGFIHSVFSWYDVKDGRRAKLLNSDVHGQTQRASSGSSPEEALFSYWRSAIKSPRPTNSVSTICASGSSPEEALCVIVPSSFCSTCNSVSFSFNFWAVDVMVGWRVRVIHFPIQGQYPLINLIQTGQSAPHPTDAIIITISHTQCVDCWFTLPFRSVVIILATSIPCV